MSDQRCTSTSPIAKFDEGPARCRYEAGHNGPHYALTSDARHVDPRFDYGRYWDDSGNFVSRPLAPWERSDTR